jgi:hypothetical protein
VLALSGRGEGVGIPVDLEVLSSPEALAKGTDAMLEAAIDRFDCPCHGSQFATMVR